MKTIEIILKKYPEKIELVMIKFGNNVSEWYKIIKFDQYNKQGNIICEGTEFFINEIEFFKLKDGEFWEKNLNVCDHCGHREGV